MEVRPGLSYRKLAQVEGFWGVPYAPQGALGAVTSDLRSLPLDIPTQCFSSKCPRIVLQLEADSPRSSSWESRLYTCSMEPSLPHMLLGESWIQALDGGSSLQAHCLHLSC